MLEGGAAGRLVPRYIVTGLDRPHSGYFIFILKKYFYLVIEILSSIYMFPALMILYIFYFIPTTSSGSAYQFFSPLSPTGIPSLSILSLSLSLHRPCQPAGLQGCAKTTTKPPCSLGPAQQRRDSQQQQSSPN